MEINTQYQSSNTQTVKESRIKSNASFKKSNKNEVTTNNDEAVIYEKNSNTSKTTSSKVDYQTIEKLKQETEMRTQQFRSLVEQIIMKQGKTVNDATDIFKLLRNGELEVDDATRQQAAEDISEDGYWGVEQTSERLFSFAKALAGDDVDKLDDMVEAFKKGFKEAEKAWGNELPDICSKTYDAFISKMDDYKKSLSE